MPLTNPQSISLADTTGNGFVANTSSERVGFSVHLPSLPGIDGIDYNVDPTESNSGVYTYHGKPEDVAKALASLGRTYTRAAMEIMRGINA